MNETEISRGLEKFFGEGKFDTLTFANGTCHFIGAFGNVGVVETEEGLVIFDIALRLFGPAIFKAVREFSDKPVKYIIYSHGHFDHVLGYAPFIDEIKKKGWDMPQVIGHENLVARFNKYRMLDKHQAWTYKQQFASVGVKPSDDEGIHESLDPTIIIQGNDIYKFKLGQFNFEVYHDKGETDDSLWLFFVEKKVIFAGDLYVSSFPNVGSPFRVQRYAHGWAKAMERMMGKNPDYLVPGHGPVLESNQEVNGALSITAEAMHFVHDEVVKRLNEGKWFEEIYFEMLDIYPEKFKNHEKLKPLYGDYRFAIHDVYRMYQGWYDSGNPTNLFPSKSEDVAKELLNVVNDYKLLEHAKKLIGETKPQLALHMLDFIIKANGGAKPEILVEALKLKVQIIKQIVKDETSFIAINIYNTSTQALKREMRELRKTLK